MPMALARAPFCDTSGAVRLDVAAVDLTGPRDPVFFGGRCQDAPSASPVPMIIDRRRGAISGWRVCPTATAPGH